VPHGWKGGMLHVNRRATTRAWMGAQHPGNGGRGVGGGVGGTVYPDAG
jgi:hypothetical protein